MTKNIEFKKKYANGTSSFTNLTKNGHWGDKPIPVGHFQKHQDNGEVRIIVPADPEKIKAYHATEEYKKIQASSKNDFRRSI